MEVIGPVLGVTASLISILATLLGFRNKKDIARNTIEIAHNTVEIRKIQEQFRNNHLTANGNNNVQVLGSNNRTNTNE